MEIIVKLLLLWALIEFMHVKYIEHMSWPINWRHPQCRQQCDDLNCLLQGSRELLKDDLESSLDKSLEMSAPHHSSSVYLPGLRASWHQHPASICLRGVLTSDWSSPCLNHKMGNIITIILLFRSILPPLIFLSLPYISLCICVYMCAPSFLTHHRTPELLYMAFGMSLSSAHSQGTRDSKA